MGELTRSEHTVLHKDIRDVAIKVEPLDKIKRKKAPKESLRIIIVLGLIALVSATLLSVVNFFTKIDQNQQMLDKIENLYSSPVRDNIEITGFANYYGTEIQGYFIAEDGASIIISKALKGGKVCYNAEGISLIVVIKDNCIVTVHSFAHSETPGLGEKALREDHLKQYFGLEVDAFYIVEGDIISGPGSSGDFNPVLVTGATYSTNGVNLAVKAAVRAYKKLGE